MSDTPCCFYCGRPTAKRPLHLRYTIDHVYPKVMVDGIKKTNKLWHVLNRVPCCSECNNYKGRLHPLDWLVIMPDPERAKKLAQLLVKMGEDMAEVFDAFRRRKRT